MTDHVLPSIPAVVVNPGPAAAPSAPNQVSWAKVVEGVARGDDSALRELYAVFAKGIRYYLWRHLGAQDLDDRVHDAFLLVIDAIRKGELREPERLMGFVRTVVRRFVATQIEIAVNARRRAFTSEVLPSVPDRHPGPEAAAIKRQNQELAMRILNCIPSRDREVLIRFYLREQTVEQICKELDLTQTQFRLVKSRAKARFGELGKARFARRNGFSAERKVH